MAKNVTIENPAEYSMVVLGSIPRSGTMYSAYLFHYLEKLLDEKTEVTGEIISMSFNVFERMKIIKFQGHMICPGYVENDKIDKTKWNELQFHLTAYNHHYHIIEWNQQIYNPAYNDKLKIIFLYRNPLDQYISYYHHLKTHINQDFSLLANELGPIEYTLKHALQSWVKQFISYQIMQRHYPDQIQFVTYENLVQDPLNTLNQLLSYVIPDHQISRELIGKSVELAAPSRIKDIEKKFSQSLAGDQIDPAISHIKSGLIGTWKKYFRQQDLKEAEAYLNQFDIDLNMFKLEN